MPNYCIEEKMKYILTDETIVICGKILHRIQACIDFNGVKAGDKGGFVESEGNLSHEGDSWVYGNTMVYGNARVFENAMVCENAMVLGYAEVYKNAIVCGNACVYGEARVYENAVISENAWACGNARIYENAIIRGDADVSGNAEICGDAEIKSSNDIASISNFGTTNRTTTFFRSQNGDVLVKCGCFFGNLEEFREQIKRTRDGYIEEEYLMIADLMEMRFKNRR